MSDTSTPIKAPATSRRGFLGTATASAAGIALAGAITRPSVPAQAATITDADVLNFALNLEYLEAEFYLRATTGQGIPSQYTTGVGNQGGVISTPPTPQVTFDRNAIATFANELAMDELNHVIFLRTQLGSAAIAEPQIDLGTAFNTLAQAAGIGSSFDPFASQTNFLLGGFIFEDVGATAYRGAAPLLVSKSYLSSAAGILGTEGYHAAGIRSMLANLAEGNPNSSIYRTTGLISNLRDQLDGVGNDDQGLLLKGVQNIVPTNSDALIFSRSTTQVLNIVYGNSSTMPGLFFPQGVNGAIQS